MFHRTLHHRVRVVCLTWSADGNSVGKALPLLGFKTYNLKAMLAQNENGQIHPQLWDNLLRPKNEHFDAFAAAAREQFPTAATSMVVKSRLAAQNKMAQRMGVATNDKLKLTDLAKYDAVAGLPVAALEPKELVDFFPQYTKFILVEETNKPEWTQNYIEEGVVPVIQNLRNMLGSGPTGKVWLSVFRHFAWPGSAETVFATLPEARQGEMVQPSFMKTVAGSTNLKDDAMNVAKAPGDMNALRKRQELAVSALGEYERQVKSVVPPERLYVFRDGDGWAPLLHFVGKEQELAATLPKFPEQSYGVDFLDQVRFRIARTQMITRLVNVVAVLTLVLLAYQANHVVVAGVQGLYADAMKAIGKADDTAAAKK